MSRKYNENEQLGGAGTEQWPHVGGLLSEFLEGGLGESERQAVEQHIALCDLCAREEREMRMLLRVLHERVPHREPSLDIWSEMQPQVEAYWREEKLPIAARFALRTQRFLHSLAAGAILFTQALAMNTENRMRKYLLSDPLSDPNPNTVGKGLRLVEKGG